MNKQELVSWLDGMREVNRITDQEFRNSTLEERWGHREQVQAMLALVPNLPQEDADGPRRRWALLKQRWLDRAA
jgi:hypothetical protein